MSNTLSEELKVFLTKENISFEIREENSFCLSDRELTFIPVPICPQADFIIPQRQEKNCIYIYEDMWRRRKELVQSRILSHAGHFRSIFARNCIVHRIDTPQANSFLEKWHSYGGARSKFRYGLFYKDQLTAVASFSAPRPMMREKIVQSYEWVRYASLPDTRVVGGMGKLLEAFVREIKAEEIMSYADLEWGDGSVYRTLGFEEAGRRPAVEFYVDTDSWERISTRKLACDKAYRDLSFEDKSSLVKINNLGSIKYIKRFTHSL